MGRVLASQLRYRRGRTATLALGILIAAVSFRLLTSAATTSGLRVRSTVGRSFRGAYDILVRRREIGTLVCLGWSRPRIFAAVLGELIMIALIAGVAGNLLAAALVAALGLEMPLVQTLLVTPVSVALATVAGLAPAMRAARGNPLDTVRPPALEPRGGRVVRTVAGMAAVNLRRLPGRTVLGMVGLAIAVAAFTSLFAITFAFRGIFRAGAGQLALAAGLAALTGTGLVAATVPAASAGLGRLLAPTLLAEE